MKIRITSVAAGAVGEKVTDITNAMEDWLSPRMADSDYGGGVKQVSIFYIATGDEFMSDLCRMHSKSGKYKSVLTGAMIKYVGIAVPLEFDVVVQSSQDALESLCWKRLLETVSSRSDPWPKEFDHERLLRDLDSNNRTG